jgi:Zn-dependent protease with chaperone function/tetratricopeptide (TPR) repeat protein
LLSVADSASKLFYKSVGVSSATDEHRIEKPLTGTAKVFLACGAAGMILFFYFFVILSVGALSVLLIFELILLVVFARFGAAAIMARVMNEHLAPLPIFVRSLWLRKGSEYRITLKREDAPDFFQILENLCDRADVRMPQTVALEMTASAWVRLKGYRRGAGRTTLGIGYDLLAGLSDAEIEGVLAHEMMHAKLVQRGFNQLLRSGLSRAVRLARGLMQQAEAARRARRSADVTKPFLRCADWLARNCARLVAACSRQDEFAADLGATKICAPGMLQSALLRLEHIERNTARLPWRERVAQLQSGEGFGNWLVKELWSPDSTALQQVKAELRSKYSTHPSLSDRLSAMPPLDPRISLSRQPALSLLAQPDEAAEKLIAEIQRLVALDEEKDSKRLDRWTRKVRSHGQTQPLQALGALAIGAGLLGGGIAWLVFGGSLGLVSFIFLTTVAGVLLCKFGGYRSRTPLPVPDFAVVKVAWEANPPFDPAKVKQIEADLNLRVSSQKGKRKQARLLAQHSYAALAQCEYLRAHTAATMCLRRNKRSIEAATVLGIAGAAMHQRQQVLWALKTLQKQTGFNGPSASWAAAWIFVLTGDWSQAEALLYEARKGRPEEPTLLALLAHCQARRGKLQSAILNSRAACTPGPPNKEYAKQLIALLLNCGFLREAKERLDTLKPEWSIDTELMFSVLKLQLLSRKFDDAAEWARLFKQQSKQSYGLVRLGAVYEGARRTETAREYYNDALAVAHFPEALLGLARIEAERKNNALAETHLLAALDIKKTVGPGGAGPIHVMHQTFSQLLALQEPILNCQAWIASLNGGVGPAPLLHHSFMIFALSREDAQNRLMRLFAAMQPGLPPVDPSRIGWRQAPKEQQPDGPAVPGIHGFV